MSELKYLITETPIPDWIDILMARYERNPTESSMWEIFIYCDNTGLPLPKAVRLRLREYAQLRTRDNETAALKKMWPKAAGIMGNNLATKIHPETGEPLGTSEASRIIANAMPGFTDPETVRKWMYNYKKRGVKT